MIFASAACRGTMSGWGIKINYVKEIEQDRAQIAIWDSPMMRAICATLTDEEKGWIAGGTKYDVIDWVMAYPEKRAERAKIVETPLEEFICGAIVADLDPPDLANDPEPEKWYSRGEAVYKKFAHIEQLVPEDKRKKYVSKYKADLSRHLRNQKKWG